MGGIIGGSKPSPPPLPKPPPPPPPPPQRDDAALAAERKKSAEALRQRAGRSASILNTGGASGLGSSTPNISRPKLLGE